MPLGIESADVNTWNKVCCFYNPSLTQVTSTFPIMTASRMLLIEAEAAQRGWIPVSYTHLDVYKRQVFTTKDVFAVGERIGVCFLLADCPKDVRPIMYSK